MNQTIRVIQVGAFDGVTADPLTPHLAAEDLLAVLLEPQPEPFKKLNAKYKSIENIQTLNMAVADHNGSLQMWSNDMEGGSAMASSAVGHGKRFAISRDALKSFTVDCITASTLMEKLNWTHIDFLQVDVEGMDWKVVSLFLATQWKPMVINFEIIHLSRLERMESEKQLSRMGYQIIDGGYDRLAFHGTLLM